jgi:hypothetical protein
MTATAPVYPVTLDVDGPVPQGRLSVFFRLILAIPHLIILYFLRIALQVVTLIAWFAILFTGKYPAGMLRFAIGCVRWQTLVSGYVMLLTGNYPPFALDQDSAYPIRFQAEERSTGRNRLTTFFRIFLVIPHLIVLALLGIAAYVVVIIAWFAALITGSVPAGLHTFLVGYNRWGARVNAYLFLLVDDYPPFSLA